MTVAVRGLRELVAATDAAGREVRRDLNAELRKVAEPVRSDAGTLSNARISGLRRAAAKPWNRDFSRASAWGEFRTGVTRRLVYVAPKRRGTRNPAARRPAFGTLLMDLAMQPALDRHEHEIEQQVERFLDEVGRRWDD